jgi:polar amino acid transport system substrate-binding protein
MITSRRTARAGLAVGALAALTLTGCIPMQVDATDGATSENGLPATIATSGAIRIGTSPDFPPMEYKDDQTQQTVGVDIDMMNALAAQWGIKVELVEAPFDQLLNSVATGRVDVVMSGISDTTERQKTVTFVDYFNSQGRFYTVAGKASGYTSATTLCGKKVAVSSKTDYYDQIANLSTKLCESAGLPAIERLGTDSGAAARLQIEQGRADLAVQGGENLAYLDTTNPGKYISVLDPLPGTPFGAVVAKDNTQLAEAARKAFEALQASGEYDKILTKWGLDYGKMPPTINGVK